MSLHGEQVVNKLYFVLSSAVAIVGALSITQLLEGQPPWEVRQLVTQHFVAVGVWLIATILTFGDSK